MTASESTTLGNEAAPDNAQSIESPSAPTWVGEDGSFSEGWLDRLPPEMKDARDTLANFKNLPDLAKSLYSTKQLLGKKSQGVVVPGEKSKPEEVAEFRKALGIPEKPEEYKIRPEKLPEGIEISDERLQTFATLAHRNNIPPEAMKALVGEYLTMEQQRSEIIANMAAQKLEEGREVLRKEWRGAEFDKNITLARRVAASAGLDVKTSFGLTDPNVVKAFAWLGRQLSDDRLVNGDSSTSMSANGAAKAKDIQTNPNNPLHEAYINGNREAVETVRNYLRI